MHMPLLCSPIKRDNKLLELIIFDCDGVLVNSEPLSARATAKALREFGIQMDSQTAMRLFTGITVSDAMAITKDQYGIDLPPEYHHRKAELVEYEFRHHLAPLSGITDLLAQLAIPVCVGSNSPHDRLKITLDCTGLAAFFVDQVYSAEDVSYGKPDPALFLHAARRNNVTPENCLVIDDSPTGILAAVAAGMPVIGFTGGTHAGPDLTEKLRSHGANWIANSHRDVTQLINTLLDNRIS